MQEHNVYIVQNNKNEFNKETISSLVNQQSDITCRKFSQFHSSACLRYNSETRERGDVSTLRLTVVNVDGNTDKLTMYREITLQI